MQAITIIGTIVFILAVGLALVGVADVLLRPLFSRAGTRQRRRAPNDARAARRASEINHEPKAANHNGRG
ncbi:MAG TPA: hypothetical protein VL598_08810 [Trinickia sp.]|jgi:hypothetical protein|uniref:hypothetical protein n=1 Tax=Trinickia sp. TaxID=2571163 RepID=UPI002B7A7A37|nr:hypothetical protein [Trinickia sp.]HTI17753.1 hypothetical protein [Trinickia sp.]